MPAPLDATDQLTAAYRGVLARRRAQVVRDWLTMWPLLKLDTPEALAQSYPGWSTAVKALLARDRAVLVQDTHAYLRTYKALAVGTEADLAGADELPGELVDTSLRVTSFVAYFRALQQTGSPLRSSKIAFVQSSGTGSRLALNAARSATINSVRRDRQGVGWERVASASACPFCSGLTGRVTRVEASAEFQAHDHCLCSARPIYR